MSRGRRSKKRKSKKRPAQAPGPSPEETTSAPHDAAWNRLRQGARNAAGVRYQVALTAWLAVESRRGQLPFVKLTPEGLEDIDCEAHDGTLWLVQAKELGAGAGWFSISKLGAVIAHAAENAPSDARIVAVTDARLRRGLVETTWTGTLATTAGVDVAKLRVALKTHGHSEPQADALLARSSLVCLPWGLHGPTSQLLAACFDIQPALGSLVLARLLDDMGRLTADQREATRESAQSFRPADLDVLVADTQALVDIEGLDAAVRDGVCVAADFTAEPGLPIRRFLEGIDAAPAHIGAGYDVLRPIAGSQVQDALADEQDRYALLAGPSGAGKSTQLWRSARDHHPGGRVVRVLRLVDDADVQSLVRHVRILEPRVNSPVLVACDDLGRPHTEAWTRAVPRLLELARHVYLLGAARQEDFNAALLARRGRLIELCLTDGTAQVIAAQLDDLGVELQMLPSEAVNRADGKMMEFIALLTTGRRLEQVLAEQAAGLLDDAEGRAAEIARVICAADTLGIGVPAERLVEATGVSGGLTPALRRLQDEHIVTNGAKDSWRGLHQLRSDVLTRLLHETPPPTLWNTLKRVLRIQQTPALCWALRRVVELYPVSADDLADVIRDLPPRHWTAHELAQLLEGLERVDHGLTARDYLPVLERNLRPGLPLMQLAFTVLSTKIAGIRFGGMGNSPLDRMGREVRRIARALPDPMTPVASAAISAIEQHTILERVLATDLRGAVRLTEAAAPYVTWNVADAKCIARRFPWVEGILPAPERYLHARLIAAVNVAFAEPTSLSTIFGSLAERLERAAAATADVLDVRLALTKAEAMLEVLHRPDEQLESRHEEWDLHPPGDAEPTNQRAVDLAEYIGWCCPELEVVEVVTLTADGDPLQIGDHRIGHKRLGRSARPSRWLVASNVGIRVALSRRASGNSWTELVRDRALIAAELLEVLHEAPRRLSSRDNAKRRGAWTGRLTELSAQLGDLPRPPVARTFDRFSASDERESSKVVQPLVGPLQIIAGALPRIVDPHEPSVYSKVAAELRDAAAKIDDELRELNALLVSGEAETYRALVDDARHLGALLIAVTRDPSRRYEVKGSSDALTTVVRHIVSEGARQQLDDDRSCLDALASLPGVAVRSVEDPKPSPSSISGHQWLICVTLAGLDAAMDLMSELADGDHPWPQVPVTLVATVDGRWLPLGMRLSAISPTGWLPVSDDELPRLAELADTTVTDGPHSALASEVNAALAMVVWSDARLRLRQEHWPRPADEAPDSLAAARAALSEAPESCDPDFVAVLDALLADTEADTATAADYTDAIKTRLLAAHLDYELIASS